MSGRAPIHNPIRRVARIASRQAQLDIRGTSGSERSGFSSSAPTSVSRTDGDGNDIVTALTELDTTDNPFAVTT